MAIDTNNEKLALINFGLPFQPQLPMSPSTLEQDDKQQLLWGYPGLLWGEATPEPEVEQSRPTGGYFFLRPLRKRDEEKREAFIEEVVEKIEEVAPVAPRAVVMEAAQQWEPGLSEQALERIKEQAKEAYLRTYKRHDEIRRKRRRAAAMLLLAG